MELSQLTDDELKNELSKREKEKKRPERPQIIENPDLKSLREICESYMEFRFSEKYHEDNDFDSYISETAVMTFYGKDVFNILNSLV